MEPATLCWRSCVPADFFDHVHEGADPLALSLSPLWSVSVWQVQAEQGEGPGNNYRFLPPAHDFSLLHRTSHRGRQSLSGTAGTLP